MNSLEDYPTVVHHPLTSIVEYRVNLGNETVDTPRSYSSGPPPQLFRQKLNGAPKNYEPTTKLMTQETNENRPKRLTTTVRSSLGPPLRTSALFKLLFHRAKIILN